MDYYNEAIVALATPYGHSALAIVRICGDDSITRFAPLFSAGDSLPRAKGYTLHHGFLSDPDSGERVDEIVAALFRAPKSYTGQDGVDILCHGSPAGIGRILDILERHGFRQADPGEFTQRAFMNGKLDLTRAEAVREVVDAQTSKAHALALQRLSGAIARRIDEIKSTLVQYLGSPTHSIRLPRRRDRRHRDFG